MLNDNETTSPLQRVLIGAGTLIVVALVIIAAIFLSVQDGEVPATPGAQITPEDQNTPGAQITPTAVEGDSTAAPLPSFTDTPTLSPTATSPATTAAPTDTPEPLPSPPTEAPPTETPTATFTPEPAPTFTPVPVPAVPPTFTPVPEPVATTNCGTPPPAGWVAYEVLTGDTFNSLSVRTGASVFTIQQANCLTGNLQSGQIVYLPIYPPTLTPFPTPSVTGTTLPTLTPTSTPFVPIVISVSPGRVDEGYANEVILTIIGRNFQTQAAGFRAELRGPENVLLTKLGPGSDTSFDAVVPVGLPSGSYDVVVTNPDDRAGARSPGFIIGLVTPTPLPPPIIIDVDPESGSRTVEHIIQVLGSNFRANDPGFRAELRRGAVVVNLPIVGTATNNAFNARVPANIETGVYDLWVINPDGKEDVEPGAYEVLP